jgi:chemotaxis protein methyltransferase CheR
MVLAEAAGIERFSILATDISTRMLDHAREGVYELAAAERIPGRLLARYCLKGVRSQSGRLLIDRALQRRITFRQLNLNGPWNALPRFRAIFLRNVMIYFDTPTKQRLIERMAGQLLPGGYLFIGHSETLNGISERFTMVVPSLYRLRP